ncbi:DUF5632 domain-containing protein [Mycobacterium avium subsp. paratuberculosis]|uniref:DUF5631 domain-containing protein n=4 Tax=Mycobacterium avium TaxID=1764 RepID=UPI000B8B407B|nr:DUF5631 domain-containing protein [Mycobacterium avium]QQK48564.1 DUF5632 domain-containing protein [Mycobacterium avium subsp. paratuberculosis]WAI54664.1 DUF5631 domain-containing protein [Mycobacterium avium subsp. paratuberculosis]
MAIFGRMTARQRLRRATRESLSIPAFSSPVDCTPWVTGGLWPAELSTVTPETATLAEYLKADLQRIADGANDELRKLKRAGMTDTARQAAEARVIEQARTRAVRRVESTIRYLHAVQSGARPPAPPRPTLDAPGADLERTQVLPAVGDAEHTAGPPAQQTPEARPRPTRRRAAEDEPAQLEETRVLPAIRDDAAAADASVPETPASEAPVPEAPAAEAPVPEAPETPAPEAPAAEAPVPEPLGEPTTRGRHHAPVPEPVPEHVEPDIAAPAEAADLEQTQVIPVVRRDEPVPEPPVVAPPEPAEEPADSGRHHAPADRDEPATESRPAVADTETAQPRVEKPAPTTAFDNNRLNRLLEFVVRQEPRLNWAIGDRADGTTILVTDLAHGWIPSGIALPAGVRLLEPERRSGDVVALIGETVRRVTYTPGDTLRRSADFAATQSSSQPRELPPIDDLATAISRAIRGRADLPKIVPRLADAAAAGAVIVDQEVDVLRVHLDTARYQLLVQYPNVNPALLLKCLLMAATEGIASGDPVSANYHLAWYRTLAAPSPGG